MAPKHVRDFRQWDFVADMNFDGQVTISDVWLWVKWLYFYPGDLVLAGVIGTRLGAFLELSTHSLGGGWSFFISIFLWVLLLGWAGTALEYVTNPAYREEVRQQNAKLHEQLRAEEAEKPPFFRTPSSRWWVALIIAAAVFIALLIWLSPG